MDDYQVKGRMISTMKEDSLLSSVDVVLFLILHIDRKCQTVSKIQFSEYSNPSKYTSLRAAEKVVHFEFVYIGIEYT